MKKKVKITELSEATVLEGLYILGVNASNQGVKAAMSLLRGLDGKEVEMRTTDTAIQYRLTGGTWKDLLSMAIIQKPATDAAAEVRKEMVQISEEASELQAGLTQSVSALQEELSTSIAKVIADTNTAKDNAIAATINAKSVSDHPGYIGAGYHVYTWDYTIADYVKTDTVLRPEGFSIYRVYDSVTAMTADADNVAEGKFVLINTESVDDPDTAKLYVKGTSEFDYLVDMSGAIGFTGKTPQISIGVVSLGDTASASLSPEGVDDAGNPRFKLNLVIVRGEQGFTPILEIGTTGTGLPGTSASVELVANGTTPEGREKYKINITIPQGMPGTGNVTIPGTGVVTGEKYFFVPDANDESTGVWVKYIEPVIPAKTSDLENDTGFVVGTDIEEKIVTHNSSSLAHNDIRQRISEVEAIARGKSRAKIFDTVVALNEWLSIPENTESLQVGDNLYIKECDVPDYWWDGTNKQPLETEKVDLSEIYNKDESNSRFSLKPIQKTVVLLPDNWIGESPYSQTIEDIDVTEGCFLEIWAIDRASREIASLINIYENVEVFEGGFSVMAEQQTSEVINTTYTIIR